MIRPTALGWKALVFFAVLWAAFFAAPYQNLFFLLLAFLSSLGAISVAWALRNVAGVTGRVQTLAPFPAGAGAVFDAELDAGPRPRSGLSVVLDVGPAGCARAESDASLGACALRGEVPALGRGVHDVAGAWLESTHPLGLFRVRRRIGAPAALVVHPAPAAAANASSGGLDPVASALGGQRGAAQPSGLRDFRAGDEIRSVHWRASARRGRPVVREWDAALGEGLEVVLDRRADEVEFEEALAVVAALVFAARDAKERLTLHTQGVSETYGPGHGSWESALLLLAAADRLPPDGPPPPPAATTVLRLPARRERASA